VKIPVSEGEREHRATAEPDRLVTISADDNIPFVRA
jgi:hypothetical protein